MNDINHKDPPKIRYKKPKNFKPEKTWEEGNRKGKPRCQGWSTTQGRQCRLNPEPGRVKCKFHGGAIPVGKASPHYKDGSRSHYAGRYAAAIANQQKLSKYYQDALSSDAILSLVPEIAITEAELSELYEDRTAFSSDLLARLRDIAAVYNETCIANEEGDQDGVLRSLARMGKYIETMKELIEEGKAADDRENVLIERKRRLTETEFRRIQADDQMILLTHAMAALAAFSSEVLEIVREKVPPDNARRVIIDLKTATGRYLGAVENGTESNR